MTLLNEAAAETQTSTEQAAPTQEATAAPALGAREIMHGEEKIVVPENFWDTKTNAPNIPALVKSVIDLRTQVSKKDPPAPTAPEKYEVRLPEELAGKIEIGETDPLASSVMAAAKEAGISQEAFDKIVAAYAGVVAGSAVDSKAEFEKLDAAFGGEAKKEVAALNTWVNGLVGKEIAADKGLSDALDSLASTADGVRLINAFRKAISASGASIPTNRDAAPKVYTETEIREMIGSSDYRTNADKQKAVSSFFASKYN